MNLTWSEFLQCSCVAMFLIYVVLQHSLPLRSRRSKQARPSVRVATFFARGGSPFSETEAISMVATPSLGSKSPPSPGSSLDADADTPSD